MIITYRLSNSLRFMEKLTKNTNVTDKKKPEKKPVKKPVDWTNYMNESVKLND